MIESTTGIWHHQCDECGYSQDNNDTYDSCPICGSPDIANIPNKSIDHIAFVESKCGRFELYAAPNGDLFMASICNVYDEYGQRFGRFVCTASRAVGYLDRTWGIVE